MGLVAAALAGLSWLTGCDCCQRCEDGGHAAMGPQPTRALAVLAPTAGSSTSGTVTFVQNGDKVTVTADVQGLQPNSTHAWHVHEFGDVSSTDGMATGSHYNPEGHPHALPTEPMRHAGDLGNLVADANGHAHLVINVDNMTIAGPRNPILGRAVIVHAKADDGGQPVGNAGGRIAQGVIGVAK
jgi:Cu-Zn family superoxide dismutase